MLKSAPGKIIFKPQKIKDKENIVEKPEGKNTLLIKKQR